MFLKHVTWYICVHYIACDIDFEYYIFFRTGCTPWILSHGQLNSSWSSILFSRHTAMKHCHRHPFYILLLYLFRHVQRRLMEGYPLEDTASTMQRHLAWSAEYWMSQRQHTRTSQQGSHRWGKRRDYFFFNHLNINGFMIKKKCSIFIEIRKHSLAKIHIYAFELKFS